MEFRSARGSFINIECNELDLESAFDNVWGKLGKIHGIIHRKERVTFEGKKAWLVWDSIVWHEVGLLFDNGKYESLASGGKAKVEHEFNRRIGMYGVLVRSVIEG